MEFRNWLNLSEMASFSIPPGLLLIPCEMGIKLPCVDKPILGIDMRFEGPPAYDPPYNRMHNGSKFAAMVPHTTKYLIYHGPQQIPDVLNEPQALRLGYLPKIEAAVDKTPGAMSEKGYYLVPNYWYLRAELIGKDNELIKPALGDFTGQRQQHLGNVTL